jgi:predicted RND superfamily exporter protein
MGPVLTRLYDSTVLDRPLATLIVVSLVTLLFGWFVPRFSLDASTDSLILETDDDLRYYRSIRSRYGSDEFLVVTYTPDTLLFNDAAIADLRALRDDLIGLDRVASVVSILDVPLLESPPIHLDDLPDGVHRLEDADTDRALAQKELLTSPLYRNLVLSPDGRTTALRVDLHPDHEYQVLWEARDLLRERQLELELSIGEQRELEALDQRVMDYSQTLLEQQAKDIAAVRAVMERHKDGAQLHLGGVPMIVADSIDFIRRDMQVFGIGVLVFLILILKVDFRRPRWITLPLLTCLATGVVMMGLLGLVDWRVTVVSSNFLSLLLILTLALSLHLIVRYRELHRLQPEADQRSLVRETVHSKAVPCLYTALTSMMAFGSLIVSGIGAVIDFGWMMVIGLAVGFLLSFTLFPAGLMLLEPGRPRLKHDLTARITALFARTIQRHHWYTLLFYAAVAVVCAAGMMRLTVENRFIDYYRKSTEIYQGMELIDRQLGGTTPLEVIIDAPPDLEPVEPEADLVPDDETDEFADEFAEFEEGLGDEAGITADSYWFNSRRLPDVVRIHDYLDGLGESGKVISLATVARVLGKLDEDVLDEDFMLSVVYKKLPDDVKQTLFEPYLSDDGDQLLFSVRVFESDPGLRRQALIDKIRRHLIDEEGLADEQVHLTGMLVLYNNMLQSLFRSQILTLGAVFIAIVIMFLVLFRSLRIAAIALVPNVISAVLVLGVMGWAGIPLDLMTITIAAITVGIGVDDSIHYVHRFLEEFPQDRDYWPTVHRCHRTIGRAMYYTSITIILGFSILALSNFVPTIYFGLLTGLAMLVALLANMTLLPVLLVVFRGAGEEGDIHAIQA